jgi:hypothetical protein
VSFIRIQHTRQPGTPRRHRSSNGPEDARRQRSSGASDTATDANNGSYKLLAQSSPLQVFLISAGRLDLVAENLLLRPQAAIGQRGVNLATLLLLELSVRCERVAYKALEVQYTVFLPLQDRLAAVSTHINWAVTHEMQRAGCVHARLHVLLRVCLDACMSMETGLKDATETHAKEFVLLFDLLEELVRRVEVLVRGVGGTVDVILHLRAVRIDGHYAHRVCVRRHKRDPVQDEMSVSLQCVRGGRAQTRHKGRGKLRQSNRPRAFPGSPVSAARNARCSCSSPARSILAGRPSVNLSSDLLCRDGTEHEYARSQFPDARCDSDSTR